MLTALLSLSLSFHAQASSPSLLEEARQALSKNVIAVAPGSRALRAGSTHFGSLWTRDFALSVGGLLKLGKGAVVKEHLELLFEAQRDDGCFPRSLDSMSTQKRVAWGLANRSFAPPRVPLRAEFEDQYGHEAIDSNLLVPIAALDYARATGDEAALAKWMPGILRALDWIALKKRGQWIEQPAYSDWQDSVKREGVTFFTHLLLWRALRQLEARGVKTPRTLGNSDLLALRMQNAFSDAKTGLYLSVLGASQVSLEGCLFAIVWGFVPEESRGEFWRALKASALWREERREIPGRATAPDYPASDVSAMNRAVGLRHYHDRMVWSWLVALSARTAFFVGDRAEGRRILSWLESRVREDGAVYELYDPRKGLKPFRSALFRSERDFSWGSAQSVEAVFASEGAF